jgi:ketosteroid isomerase-like protein
MDRRGQRPRCDRLINDENEEEQDMGTREVAQTFMDRISAVEFLEAFGMLAQDGIYTVIGTTPASGVYKGRDDLFARLIPVLATFIEPPVLKWQDPVIEGDRAVLLAAGSGQGPTGPYDQPYYAFVTRVRGDEFVEIVEFMDTAMLESAVFGKSLETA